MTKKQAEALALLVGGKAINGKVYMTKPEINGSGNDRMCEGCAFAHEGILPARGTEDRIACDAFNICAGVIRVELKV